MIKRHHAPATPDRNFSLSLASPSWSIVIVLGLLLSGCQEIKIPGVYRIDIQQGNVITQAQLAKLELGMERRKVRFIMGTPLVEDAFNQNRWDYYYSFEPGNGEREQRIISVFFNAQGLIKVGGGVRAASGPIKVEKRRDQLVKVPPGLNNEGLFASLAPSFLANRKKTIDLDKIEKSPDQTQTAPTQDAYQAPEVEITDADQKFLTDLFKDYGKTLSSAQNSTPVPSREVAQNVNSDTSGGEYQPPSDDESIFSRWAKRLGIKTDDNQEKDASTPGAAAADASIVPASGED